MSDEIDFAKAKKLLRPSADGISACQIRIEALRAASRVLQGALELDDVTVLDIEKDTIRLAEQFATWLEK